ncbi:MAG TPA: CHAD domain-containing protein [Solirubrobacteraceae bacterium]|nr:CHAD domain-containing protein [Solirubrobacteraceae bacterium]
MKARKVRGLDPAGALGDNAQRIVAVRLDELTSFVPRALDPAEVEALHDMRIAAKRLRYVLEVTGPCFGAYAREAVKRAKELQDLLGEIHDCDVLVPRLLDLTGELRNAAVADVVHRAGGADDVDPALAAQAPHREAWRGLEALVVHLRARREVLFARFLAMWADLERAGFAARLRDAITERPVGTTVTTPS